MILHTLENKESFLDSLTVDCRSIFDIPLITVFFAHWFLQWNQPSSIAANQNFLAVNILKKTVIRGKRPYLEEWTLPIFRKLLQHFSRHISSADIGATRTFLFLVLPLVLISISAVIMILISYKENVVVTNPGWTSIFLMELILLITLGALISFSAKMYSILAIRSLGLPSFQIIDRSKDQEIYSRIKYLSGSK